MSEQASNGRRGGLVGRLVSVFRAFTESMAPLVKSFEWTWTTAVVFSVAFVFVIMISMTVIPSFWMYFAEQKLGWDGPASLEELFTDFGDGSWQPVLRDAIAMGLTTGPLITFLVIAVLLQNWRRRLRGQADSRPAGGYR